MIDFEKLISQKKLGINLSINADNIYTKNKVQIYFTCNNFDINVLNFSKQFEVNTFIIVPFYNFFLNLANVIVNLFIHVPDIVGII